MEFDGVYGNASVDPHGRRLGNQPYGYTSFHFDRTPGPDFSGPNVVTVRASSCVAGDPQIRRSTAPAGTRV